MKEETALAVSEALEPAAAHHEAALAHLVAALQALQALGGASGPADQPGGGYAAPLIQLALAVLSQGDSSHDPMTLGPERLEAFAAVLRDKRRAAGLGQEQLAKLASVSKRTIYNIEAARQAPSRATLCRLLAVPALRLHVSDFSSDITADPAWAPNCWFASRYDPSQLQADMVQLLNGPGGQLEQTYLYLEPASANDYMALCSSAPVFVGFRNQAPLEQIAAQIAKRFAGVGVDVTALGSGDGRSEVRLVQALASARGARPDLKLYLLDISHTLLTAAHKHATATLGSSVSEVFALHINFHDLARYPVLHSPRTGRRRRLYTLLGGTMANLDNEVRFFQDLGHCAAAGDLCVIDIQLAYGPAERPDEIRRKDPPLAGPYDPPHLKWITGPLERHCHGLASINLRIDLTTHCPVPGSYELNNICHVKMRDGLERRYMVFRVKRYDAERLEQCLDGLGWQCLATLKYGVGAEKTAAVMLLRRK